MDFTAIFLTSSIVASSIEAQAANLEDSLGRTIVVTASDASFDSSATISEDILNFTNNMSLLNRFKHLSQKLTAPASVRFLPKEAHPIQRPYVQEVRFISGQTRVQNLKDLFQRNWSWSMAGCSMSPILAHTTLGVEAAFLEKSVLVDSLELEGVSFNVVGLISGEVFQTNATALMSIDIAQAITETTGFDKVVITIDSIELVDDTMNFLCSEFGDEVTVQTASDQQGDDIAQSIDTIGGNADLGAMAALFASLFVVGFIMVIITKERVNEIGVLKAIGFPQIRKSLLNFERIDFHGVSWICCLHSHHVSCRSNDADYAH